MSIFQRLFFLQTPARPLTKTEGELLLGVFGDSLAQNKIRLIEGRSGLFGVNSRPFTLGNMIYMKTSTAPEILIHECVHVWQYQHLGPRYAAEALGAQLLLGYSAYDWQAELARGKSDWGEFNREAQAQLIQDISSRRISTMDQTHGQLITTAIQTLRATKNVRNRV